MIQTIADRRKGRRFFLGVPSKARIAERADPLILELMDVAASGARLQVHGDAGALNIHDHVAFRFVVPGWPNCQAKGQIVRFEPANYFALALDDANEAFDGFIRLVSCRTWPREAVNGDASATDASSLDTEPTESGVADAGKSFHLVVPR